MLQTPLDESSSIQNTSRSFFLRFLQKFLKDLSRKSFPDGSKSFFRDCSRNSLRNLSSFFQDFSKSSSQNFSMNTCRDISRSRITLDIYSGIPSGINQAVSLGKNPIREPAGFHGNFLRVSPKNFSRDTNQISFKDFSRNSLGDFFLEDSFRNPSKSSF